MVNVEIEHFDFNKKMFILLTVRKLNIFLSHFPTSDENEHFSVEIQHL